MAFTGRSAVSAAASPQPYVDQAVAASYAELASYDYASPGFSAATGHFTALVWAATRRVVACSAFARGDVPAVVTAAHQLHGAIGVTIEHRLWLVTMRARSWIDEFGDTAHYARRLGRMALETGDSWDLIVGNVTHPAG